MKKILVIDTTYPINSRTARFKNSLSKSFQIIIVAWNRGKKVGELQDYYVFESNIGYGKQLKKLLYFPLFINYCCKVFREEKPNAIFASHWDSLICAVFMRIFFAQKTKIIYDCLDLPTSSNKYVRYVLNSVEKRCLKWVDLTIFASRYFKQFYASSNSSYIFENYPSIEIIGAKSDASVPVWYDEKYKGLDLKQKSVSWIGVVRYFDILNNILLAIKGTDVCLYVFGDGPDLEKLKKTVEDYSLTKQVVFFGRYNLSDLKFIYSISQCVWASYPTNDFNAVYAISNKYFECSFFEKDIVLSQKTKMAESLYNNKNVILVDEYSFLDIRESLLKYFKECITIDVAYDKYELDISWEEKEPEMVHMINNVLKD